MSSHSEKAKKSIKKSKDHLLIVEDSLTISKEDIGFAKYDNVDVLYITKRNLIDIESHVSGFEKKWKTVNILCHGNVNLSAQSITVFNVEMSMNRNIMWDDPNTQFLKNTMSMLTQYCKSLYIYTCVVGLSDGLKELCIAVSKTTKCDIYLSTNVTGDTGDWDIEWCSSLGFLDPDRYSNNINHAKKDLFKDVKLLSFDLQKFNNPDWRNNSDGRNQQSTEFQKKQPMRQNIQMQQQMQQQRRRY